MQGKIALKHLSMRIRRTKFTAITNTHRRAFAMRQVDCVRTHPRAFATRLVCSVRQRPSVLSLRLLPPG